MLLKAILALCAVSQFVSALDFSSSKWIWTSEPAVPWSQQASRNAYPPESRAFRRDYYAPDGKQPVSANILLAVDNTYVLYVNGVQVGTGTENAYCVKLKGEGCNVFALNVTNWPDTNSPPPYSNPAGVLAAIQIRYADGFTNTIVSDASWHAFPGNIPAGFQNDNFDDSAWPAAIVQGDYGISPWGAIGAPTVASNVGAASPPTMDGANWIWTSEAPTMTSPAPNGSRAFRRKIVLPPGQAATSANIIIAVDDQFTLFVNGKQIDSSTSPNWGNEHRDIVNFDTPVTEITLAITGTNTGGGAAVIAKVELLMEDCDCGSVMSYVTDANWKYSLTVPSGYQDPGYDDSNWPAAIVKGPYTGNLTPASQATVVEM